MVTLTLTQPDNPYAALGGPVPVQLAALQIERGAVVSSMVSTPQDPSGGPVTLSLAVPKSHCVVLFLQTPHGNPSSLGQLVGKIVWSNGHGGQSGRLNLGDANVDLGTLALVTGAPDTLADNTATVADDHNPLRLTDQDNNGLSDFVSMDDDGDGMADTADTDADGDGLLDAEQELSALPDSNGVGDGDGVPDDLE